MTLSLSAFVNELNTKGPARSNLFIVEFGSIVGKVKQEPLGAHDPAVNGSFSEKDVMGNEMHDTEKLALYVRSLSVPGWKIEKHEQTSDRIPYDSPGKFSFSEFTIDFLCDASMVQKHYFQEWMANVVDPSAHTHAFYNDYTTGIVIKMFDTKGTLRNVIELTECWPTAVDDISLAYGQADKFVEFKVTFAYRLMYETQVTKSSFTTSFGAGDIEEGGAAIGGAANEFQSLLAGTGFQGIGNFIGGIGTTVSGVATTVSGIAKRGGAIVDATITQPISKVRGIQSTVSTTINKVTGVGAKGISGTKDLRNVVPGAKNLLNVLKR